MSRFLTESLPLLEPSLLPTGARRLLPPPAAGFVEGPQKSGAAGGRRCAGQRQGQGQGSRTSSGLMRHSCVTGLYAYLVWRVVPYLVSRRALRRAASCHIARVMSDVDCQMSTVACRLSQVESCHVSCHVSCQTSCAMSWAVSCPIMYKFVFKHCKYSGPGSGCATSGAPPH